MNQIFLALGPLILAACCKSGIEPLAIPREAKITSRVSLVYEDKTMRCFELENQHDDALSCVKK